MLRFNKLKIIILSFLILNFSRVDSQNMNDEIIVKSTKLQSDGIFGSQTYIITKDDIQGFTGDSVVDLITKFPGVKKQFDIYGTGFGVGARVDIRGFADTARDNTAILINGQKLTLADMSLVDLSIIPIDSIKRIEITKGNNSVLYGNNSTAGTVNIITDILPDEEDSIFTKFTVGSFGKFEGAFSGTKSSENFTISGNTNFISSNGFRRNNALSQRNGNIELKGINGDYSFNLNILSHNQFLELPGTRSVTTLRSDPRGTGTPVQFNQRNGYKAFYGLSYVIDSASELIFDGVYSFDKSQANMGEFSDTEIYNVQLSPRYLLNHKLKGMKLDTILGADLIWANYYSDRMQTDGAQYYTKIKMTDKTLAVYLNSNIELNYKNYFSVGARYHGNWLDASNSVTTGAYYGGTYSDKDSETFSTPQYAYHLGYSFKPNNTNEFTTKVGRSFRYPNLDERIGRNATSFTLGPQKSYDIEFGHRFNTSDLTIETSLFYMRLRAEISTTDNSFYNRNLDPTERFGIENSISYKINNDFDVQNNLALTQAKFRGGSRNGHDLPGVPELVNSVDLNYSPLENLSTYFNFYYQSSSRPMNDFSNYQIVQKGYHTLNIGFKTSFKGFDATLALNNLQDKIYYNYAVGSGSGVYHSVSYYPLPGFNSLLKISKKF